MSLRRLATCRAAGPGPLRSCESTTNMQYPALLPFSLTFLVSCGCGDETGKCEGTPVACAQMTEAFDCGAQQGCEQVEVCRGDLAPCAEYGASQSACEFAQCSWDGLCSGTMASGISAGESCEAWSHRAESCTSEPGCTFSGGCVHGGRRPLSCAEVTSMSACQAVAYADCYPGFGCGGEPLPCDELPTAGLCQAQAGCSWTQ